MKHTTRKEREEDILAREKNCTHCKEKYSFSAMMSYLMKVGSYRITCLSCFEHSYMDKPLNGAAYGTFQIIAFAVGVAFFLLVNGLIYLAGYISGIGFAIGIIGGIAISGFLMRAYKWKYGRPVAKDPL
jgi:uncharacterized membrane protein (DUF485 family)